MVRAVKKARAEKVNRVVSPELFEQICELLETTDRGVNRICEELGTNKMEFYRRIRKCPEDAARYVIAQEHHQEAAVEGIHDIEEEWKRAIDKEDDPKRLNAINTFYREKIATIKWTSAHRKPKVFGDKVDITSGGDKLPTPPSELIVRIVENKVNV